ncbi:MAG: cell division protein FtsQ/DivIB [Coriobacteriia bacterium]|nr:cell division protein FtsQ/DivIB [Coriobacteriia bacterium]
MSFPNTLVINVTERSVTAIVEVPVSSSDKTMRNWAISSDHMWLMPVPDKNSEAAKNISQQIFADVEGVMHIVDVSPSVQPEIGSYCSDDPVNNAIDVVAAMTTDLKNQVKYVKASDANSTNLFLNNGVEIAVGTSENLREKERVAEELLSKYEGKISYINVRNASNPTWRSI